MRLTLGLGLTLLCFTAFSQTSDSVDFAAVQKLILAGDNGAAETAVRRELVSLDAAGKADSLEAAQWEDLLGKALLGQPGDPERLQAAVQRSIAIKSRLLGPQHSSIAVSLGILANQTRLAGDFKAAVAAYEKARQLQDQSAGAPPREVAEVLNGLGLAIAGQGQFGKARQVHEQALAILVKEAGPDAAATGEVDNNLALDCLNNGDMPAATSYARRALAIFERELGPDRVATGNAMGNLASSLRMTGDYAGARPLHERAVAIYEVRLGADHPRLIPLLNNLALCLKQLGEYDKSAEAFERALHISETRLGAEHPSTATVLANVGILYQETGDFRRARECYERALRIQEKRLGPEHTLVASALNSLGLLLIEMADFADAKQKLERAVAIFEKSTSADNPKTGEVLNSLGTAMAGAGDLPGAKRVLHRAIDHLSRTVGAANPKVAATRSSLGDVLLQSREYAAARAQYEEALAILEKEVGARTHVSADVKDRLGDVMEQQGDWAAAAAWHKRAVDTWTEAMGPGNFRLMTPLAGLARALAHLGRKPEALDAALESARLRQTQLRLTIQAIPERQALLYSTAGRAGLDVALSLVAEGAVSAAERREVWDVAIRDRALVLDEMTERRHTASSAGDSETAAMEQRLGAARERLARLVVQGPGDSPVAEYAARLTRARNQVETEEEALATRIRRFRRRLDSARVGFREVAAALPAGVALAAFVEYERDRFEAGAPRPVRSYLGFVLKAGQDVPSVAALGPAKEMDALVSGWRREIDREGASAGRNPQSNEREYRRAGLALRRAVWDPLSNQLQGASKVFLVPDGTLQLVNVATLPVGATQYLAERGPLLHTFSAERDLAEHSTAAPGQGMLIVGNPAFQSAPVRTPVSAARSGPATCRDMSSLQFQPLPGSAAEMQSIVSIWKTQHESAMALTGSQATEGAFKRNAAGKRVLHLATHGFFVDDQCRNATLSENPLLRAGLALAGANRRQSAPAGGEDGILTAEEVASLNLEGTEWVVLSGCETSSGEVHNSEGVFGLRRAFQIAGARTLVATLWSIEDESARHWMEALYRSHFQGHRSTAEAMRQATLDELKQRRAKGASTHPFYWGSFVAAGGWQ